MVQHCCIHFLPAAHTNLGYSLLEPELEPLLVSPAFILRRRFTTGEELPLFDPPPDFLEVDPSVVVFPGPAAIVAAAAVVVVVVVIAVVSTFHGSRNVVAVGLNTFSSIFCGEEEDESREN